ncbi:MAG: DSD1 family PLP-dependent enzyme [Pseudomonadales bacterium]
MAEQSWLVTNRRKLLLGGALAAGAYVLKPNDKGGPYNAYFSALNQTLKASMVSQPRMVLDLDAIDANIDAITSSIKSPKQWRVVVKSLPSMQLLDYIMRQANTRALMAFHQPFLNQVAQQFPNTDVLLGKPLPAAAALKFYQTLGDTKFSADKQLQWLLDSVQRLQQYQSVAQSLGVTLRINLELDVGLHRGGFSEESHLLAALKIINNDSRHLKFSGFMGYEPHVVKLPNTQSLLEDVKSSYHKLVDAAKRSYPQLFENELTYNIAGSQTYSMYETDTFFNDISAGSGVVMPTDFDMSTLASHRPASYVAAPVLKHYDDVKISGLEGLSSVFSAWNPNRQQAWYLYGGNWQAEYESPPGLLRNPIWGHSSNQEMINGSDKIPLKVDDFVFMRPRQSEAVFLQFGDLLAVRNGQLVDEWPVLGV